MFRPNTGGYGYGWSVNKIKLSNGRILRTVSHTGTTSGFRSIICRFIDKHTTIIILCNQDNADVSAISDAIRTILFNRAESSKSNNNSILYEDILKAK
ncbi:MAG TPA: serine hydrolase, partial [Ignavibacteriales bacterium]|nr:serine hydrolase [Ignavibacteriales bacterium]